MLFIFFVIVKVICAFINMINLLRYIYLLNNNTIIRLLIVYKLKGCDEMAENYTEARRESFGIGHFIIRWIVGAVVLAITAFFTRGFSIANLWSLLIAALVIAGLDFLVAKVFNVNASPFGRGDRKSVV